MREEKGKEKAAYKIIIQIIKSPDNNGEESLCIRKEKIETQIPLRNTVSSFP